MPTKILDVRSISVAATLALFWPSSAYAQFFLDGYFQRNSMFAANTDCDVSGVRENLNTSDSDRAINIVQFVYQAVSEAEGLVHEGRTPEAVRKADRYFDCAFQSFKRLSREIYESDRFMLVAEEPRVASIFLSEDNPFGAILSARLDESSTPMVYHWDFAFSVAMAAELARVLPEGSKARNAILNHILYEAGGAFNTGITARADFDEPAVNKAEIAELKSHAAAILYSVAQEFPEVGSRVDIQHLKDLIDVFEAEDQSWREHAGRRLQP